MKKICVLGLGYIGLPTAAMFATQGFQVIGVDVNDRIVDVLSNGEVHIDEPGLKTLVQAALKSGNLEVAGTPRPAQAFIIAVPTPLSENGSQRSAELSYVISATESIVPHLQPGNLVVLESTVPPRTTVDTLLPILARSGLAVAGAATNGGIPTDRFFLAHCPERVLPGRILEELVCNDRVIGGVDRPSALAARALYSSFVKGDFFLTDATTAEMIKLMENTYRDVNIAIANEFSRLADHLGIDVWEAITVANRHPRVNILHPGPGVGGHCIGVDPWFLIEAAPKLTPLIHTSRQVNDSQPQFVIENVQRGLGGLNGRRIAILGLAYKPDVDDLRESPAVEIAHLLSEQGAIVKAFEPFKTDACIPGLTIVSTLEDVVKDADAFLLLTGHRQFRVIDPQQIVRYTPARVAIDVVNGWERGRWEAAGFRVFQLGVGRKQSASTA